MDNYLYSREYKAEDTVIKLGSHLLGGGHFAHIAGPCAVESLEQIITTAEAVKAAGAVALRGGAFKPRTSPYTFRGLGKEGIDLLLQAKKAVGLPIVSEITSVSQLALFRDVDVLQIGARNMQNFELLQEVGKVGKPVLLKRGVGSTVEEWLFSAEYVLLGGTKEVILCERGVRSFSGGERLTLDLSSIKKVKQLTHLPVIVDPSHVSSNSKEVMANALAAVGAGCDGLITEVHCSPNDALCDGRHALNTEEFLTLTDKVRGLLDVIGRTDL